MISIKVPMTVPIVASVIVGAFFTSTAGAEQEQDDAGLPYSLELGRAWSATHRDENGWTDLHYAAVVNRPDLVRRLLDAGASMEARLVSDDDWFSWRLKETLAAFNIPFDRVFSMVMGDYDYRDRRIWDATPLDLAIANDAGDVVELLLDRGANLAEAWVSDLVLVMPPTPLLRAVYIGSVDVVKLLLNRGADLEVEARWAVGVRFTVGGTPLEIAGSVEMAELLLDRGASLEHKGLEGDTLLHDAARRGLSGKVELLLNRGMNIDEVNDNGVTPLWVAGLYRPAISATYVYYRDSEMIELLLDRGANLEFKSPNGNTLLHDVARRGDSEVAELLLDRGANIEAVNDDGQTPLDIATTNEVVDLLSNR